MNLVIGLSQVIELAMITPERQLCTLIMVSPGGIRVAMDDTFHVFITECPN